MKNPFAETKGLKIIYENPKGVFLLIICKGLGSRPELSGCE